MKDNTPVQHSDTLLVSIASRAMWLTDQFEITFDQAMLVITEQRLALNSNDAEKPLELEPDIDDSLSDTTQVEQDRAGADRLKVQRIGSNNSSGCVGVSWNKESEKWVAYITKSGKHYHLISTNNWWDAVCARKAAEIEHGFHV